MYSNDLVCDILIYLHNNINNKIEINDLEMEFHYNRYYLMKRFKKEINITIINYINSIRIYNSIRSIENTSDSFLSIALRNGFSSLEYFSETFKLVTGLNPSDFRKFFIGRKISDNKYIMIQEVITKLYEISTIKDSYLSRRRPTMAPTKKLSLFK